MTEDKKKTEPKEEYVPEPSNSGVPKNFMIRCPRCQWARRSSGVSSDLTDIYEVKNNCSDCGKWRHFRCPKCGMNAPMKRIKGNS